MTQIFKAISQQPAQESGLYNNKYKLYGFKGERLHVVLQLILAALLIPILIINLLIQGDYAPFYNVVLFYAMASCCPLLLRNLNFKKFWNNLDNQGKQRVFYGILYLAMNILCLLLCALSLIKAYETSCDKAVLKEIIPKEATPIKMKSTTKTSHIFSNIKKGIALSNNALYPEKSINRKEINANILPINLTVSKGTANSANSPNKAINPMIWGA